MIAKVEGIRSSMKASTWRKLETKELEDNSQNKDDRKDPKLIANLIKDGNYGCHISQKDCIHICGGSQCSGNSLSKTGVVT